MKKTWLFPAPICVMVGAVYAGAVGGSFQYDDVPNIVANRSIQGPVDIGAIWELSHTRFVGNLSFAVNRAAVYMDPTLTPAVYLMTQLRVIPLYLWLIALPYGQTVDHDIAASTGFGAAEFGGLLVIAGALAFGWWRYRRDDYIMAFGVFWQPPGCWC